MRGGSGLQLLQGGGQRRKAAQQRDRSVHAGAVIYLHRAAVCIRPVWKCDWSTEGDRAQLLRIPAAAAAAERQAQTAQVAHSSRDSANEEESAQCSVNQRGARGVQCMIDGL